MRLLPLELSRPVNPNPARQVISHFRPKLPCARSSDRAFYPLRSVARESYINSDPLTSLWNCLLLTLIHSLQGIYTFYITLLPRVISQSHSHGELLQRSVESDHPINDRSSRGAAVLDYFIRPQLTTQTPQIRSSICQFSLSLRHGIRQSA